MHAGNARHQPYSRYEENAPATVAARFRAVAIRASFLGTSYASSRPSTGTYGGRRDAPSTAHSPSSVSPRIRRSDMRRSVSGFGSGSRIQRCSGGTFSSWSPLTGESLAFSVAGGNNGNRNDSCQAPFGVGDLAVPEIPRNAVGVMAQNQCRLHKNPTPLCGHKSAAGWFRPNRICI